jgi:hypothetical protein
MSDNPYQAPAPLVAERPTVGPVVRGLQFVGFGLLLCSYRLILWIYGDTLANVDPELIGVVVVTNYVARLGLAVIGIGLLLLLAAAVLRLRRRLQEVTDRDKKPAHPLNAPGDFYVENGYCIACHAPEHEAPDLMSSDAAEHCYFNRQPKTPDELQRAIMAVAVGCRGAVRYGGQDQHIIKQLSELRAADFCNHSRSGCQQRGTQAPR